MKATGIQWVMRQAADGTWVRGNTLNVVEGCSRVSPGCFNCYAESVAWRFKSFYTDPRYGPSVVHEIGGEPRWTGALRFHHKRLVIPYARARAEAWFWNSMSDWMHESLSRDQLYLQLGAMAAASTELFMTLTKRAARQREVLSDPATPQHVLAARNTLLEEWTGRTRTKKAVATLESKLASELVWPLPNLWVGASAEDQTWYSRRREELEATPAAVRWWSLEPLLGPIALDTAHVDWIVVGGESGDGSRDMQIGWAEDILDSAAEQGIPAFMKQTGEVAARRLKLHDKKGGDEAEWPAEIRVRQFPPQVQVVA